MEVGRDIRVMFDNQTFIKSLCAGFPVSKTYTSVRRCRYGAIKRCRIGQRRDTLRRKAPSPGGSLPANRRLPMVTEVTAGSY
jgi:hypothetical protein